MSRKNAIPVIDLFAGPGRLCEGFSSVFDETGARRFAVKVSVEMDPIAHRTLLLRAIFRKFPKGKVPDAYYDYVRGKLTREAFLSHPEIKDAAEQATKEARCAELGVTPAEEVDAWIQTALGNQTDWVLIGGERSLNPRLESPATWPGSTPGPTGHNVKKRRHCSTAVLVSESGTGVGTSTLA